MMEGRIELLKTSSVQLKHFRYRWRRRFKLNDFYFRVSDTDNSSPSPSPRILVDSSHRHRPLYGCGTSLNESTTHIYNINI